MVKLPIFGCSLLILLVGSLRADDLQGTWQAISWEDEEGIPHDPKVEDPKVEAEILKFVRWKFEDKNGS